MNKVLDGIMVIELATHGACPSAGRILSDWGARVIKVEAPNGDFARQSGQNFNVPVEESMNPHFDLLNDGKESIAIDLKSEQGKEVMGRLLKRANVFLTNMRSDALMRLGLDYENVNQNYPYLIWAHLTGFGNVGPRAASPGFDTVAYYAKTGMMLDFAEKDTPPINAPYGVGDLSAGSTLAGGIAAALFKQEKTGRGSKVTISLYGQSIWAMGIVLQSVYHGAVYPRSRKAAKVPLNNCYQCADGEWIYISVLQYDRYFKEFCKVIGCEDLIQNDKYNTFTQGTKHNEELIEIISDAFLKHTSEEWKTILAKTDLAYDTIDHMEDVLHDPQAEMNHYVNKISYDNGKSTVIVAPPVHMGDYPGMKSVHSPKLSENAESILTEIGYDKASIDAMFLKNIAVKP